MRILHIDKLIIPTLTLVVTHHDGIRYTLIDIGGQNSARGKGKLSHSILFIRYTSIAKDRYDTFDCSSGLCRLYYVFKSVSSSISPTNCSKISSKVTNPITV